jgi:hypothetical protein
MRTIRLPVAVLFLALAAGFCPARAQTRPKAKPASKAAAGAEVKGLIRKDLLRFKTPEAAPPKRNIFAPRSGPSRPAGPGLPAQPQPAPSFSEADKPTDAKETPSAPPAITVNLRYIGFIESPRRLVALVIYEGRAVAVVEGDVIGEGIRIGKVNRDEVEVVLPDSSTRTFSLEGDEG